VDRFTFSTYIPDEYFQEQIVNQTKFYPSYIYDLYIEITYDEDNKLVRTPHMLILAENNYPDGITDRIFVQQLLKTTSHDLTAIDKIQEYSQYNQKNLQILS